MSTSSLRRPASRARARRARGVLFGACAGAAASPSPVAVSRRASAAVATAAPPASPDAAPTPGPASRPTSPTTRAPRSSLAAEPQKIVSLTPADTEILFALGAGDRVVATDDASDYPDAEAKALPDVATFGVGRCREDRRPGAPTSSSPAASASTRPTRSRSSATLGIPVARRLRAVVDGVYKDIELLGDGGRHGRRGRRR